MTDTNVCGVYIFRHLKSGKMYVGSSSDVLRRKARHENELKNGTHPNIHFQRAFNEDPLLEFNWWPFETRELAYDGEQKLLDQNHAAGLLFNISVDAREFGYGIFYSQEVREKISAANRGKIVAEETRMKIGASKLGVPRPESVKEALRKARTGTTASDETRALMSQVRKGMKMPPRTAEHTEKIRKAKEGFTHSAETIQKLREGSPKAQRVSIAGVVYSSIAEAERQLGLSHRAIRARIAKTDKHLDWFYLEN